MRFRARPAPPSGVMVNLTGSRSGDDRQVPRGGTCKVCAPACCRGRERVPWLRAPRCSCGWCSSRYLSADAAARGAELDACPGLEEEHRPVHLGGGRLALCLAAPTGLVTETTTSPSHETRRSDRSRRRGPNASRGSPDPPANPRPPGRDSRPRTRSRQRTPRASRRRGSLRCHGRKGPKVVGDTGALLTSGRSTIRRPPVT